MKADISTRAGVIGALLWLATAALAHPLSTAHLNARMQADRVQLQLRVEALDLNQMLGLDSNRDAQLSWQEISAAQARIEAWAVTHVLLEQGPQRCQMQRAEPLRLDHHLGRAYAVLDYSVRCPTPAAPQLTYLGAQALPPGHKLILLWQHNGEDSGRVLDVHNPSVRLAHQASVLLDTLKEFARLGVVHIWIGLDHMVFVLCLLLACLLHSAQPGQPWPHILRSQAGPLLKVITAFTVAHSITLMALALGWIALPGRWVETAIAASILITALNNIKPLLRRIGALGFLFGLLHGMGFAGVLLEIGLPVNQRLEAALAFNLGIEAGQILLLLVLLPAALALMAVTAQPARALKTASAAVALLAGWWMVVRW